MTSADQGAAPARSAEELIAEYDAERPARHLTGRLAIVVGAIALGVSLYALYVVFNPMSVLPYRMSFLAAVLPLTFLAYRPGLPRWLTRRRAEAAAAQPDGAPPVTRRDVPGVSDWVLAALSLAVCAYPLFGFDDFIRRTFEPSTLDLVMGAGCLLLVLEATRRTVGPILPGICVAFLAYAYYGGYLPVDSVLGHRGYGIERIVVQLYMGTEGLFGVPLDVAATYIVLFTIYGAVLEYSGAGAFFVNISFAAFRRSAAAPGRTVTLAGFLLGTVSGSGTATAVSLGSVAWPILRRAGYPREHGGGILAAAGIGAILSPPTLGAAAFIIAEYLKVSYLTVLLYATVPTVLYYLGIILAVEIDARRFGTHGVEMETGSAWRLLGRFGYHFSSLVAIVVLMAFGVSPFRAVVYATVLAFLLSFLDREHRLGPRRAAQALSAGTLGVLPVAATTAAAGVIVAMVTLTGLGLKASRIIVDLAGGHLALTALVAALAVLLLGLAVPVTASFIIAAVIIGPALQTLGVPPDAAYMFIFYYAVLSEVTPPTALAAVAAAAITGGNAFRTMMMTWKYTLPAFLVPFAFVLAPAGRALLLQAPLPEVLLALAVSAVAVAALAAATGGWMVRRAGWPERVLAAGAAVALLFLEPVSVVAGLALLAVALLVHLALRRPVPVQGTQKGT
ncbi:TRAP transporter permease [Nonomuraea muscovyensis]|uniref:TRAP transporter 4TM/12TM fusion protein n=1 Tax=Nonomuraea muscovyensis TaxID=1124761 RepID=A0A7X0C634_9ACTN|nr:TRAP transporter fused permease subunit [Nonomuraea muscovyensis]MBB6349209.1 TRAP transporter 4TM/12TM fusion protein [Nonomuraea muscovyensis]MDF2704902.1 transporter fused permease subunit [Nonomuraea muscovyensis]